MEMAPPPILIGGKSASEAFMSEGNISVSNLDQIRALGQPAPNVPIRSDNHDANNTLVLSKRELSVQRNVSVGELRAEDNSVNSRKLRARTLSSPNLGAVVVSSKQERRRESQMEDSAAKFEETKASLYSSGRAKLNKAKKAKRTSQRSADPTRSPSLDLNKVRVLQPRAIVKEMLSFLADPSNLDDFYSYLKLVHAEENLEFYVEVEALHASQDEETTKLLCVTLYEEYLQPNAPRMVNVEGRFAEPIEQQVLNGEYSKDMFDEAQRIVVSLIAENSWAEYASASSLSASTRTRVTATDASKSPHSPHSLPSFRSLPSPHSLASARSLPSPHSLSSPLSPHLPLSSHGFLMPPPSPNSLSLSSPHSLPSSPHLLSSPRSLPSPHALQSPSRDLYSSQWRLRASSLSEAPNPALSPDFFKFPIKGKTDVDSPLASSAPASPHTPVKSLKENSPRKQKEQLRETRKSIKAMFFGKSDSPSEKLKEKEKEKEKGKEKEKEKGQGKEKKDKA